ncbi:MAG: hypothetical protein GY821_14620 [Gammaproteobacteria bacterium]|nr:hypothetical protein [Gammaproteobacteria bacterium]
MEINGRKFEIFLALRANFEIQQYFLPQQQNFAHFRQKTRKIFALRANFMKFI